MRIKFIFIFIFIFSFLISIYAEEKIFEVSKYELEKGIVIEFDGKSYFVKEKRKEGEIIEIAPSLKIKVIPSKPKKGKDLLIPVEIFDNELAKGVEIKLGEKTIKIPKRRVILPHKFCLVFPGLGEPGEDGGPPGHLILEVHPIISYPVSIELTETGDEGLVAKVEYQDLVKSKAKDVLNKMGRRDIDIMGFIKTSQDEKVGLNTENLLEVQNPRKIDLYRLQKLSKRVKLEVRLDNIQGKEKINVGGNLIYRRRNKEFNFGNVDRKVQDEIHLQIKFIEKRGNIITRLEGISFQENKDFVYSGIYIKKLGAQINYENIWKGIKLTVGSLKIEDNNEQGRCDDKINLETIYSNEFGNLYPPFGVSAVTLGSLIALRVMGVGEDWWLRSRGLFSLNLDENTSLQFELNDDFITFSGNERHNPWQNRRLTLIRYKKLFDDKSILGKLNLEYVFAEAKYQRENYYTPFHKTVKYCFGFGKNLNFFGFGLPLEISREDDYEGKYQYRVIISLRQWI